MPCPSGRFTADAFRTAMENFELWKAAFCPYGAPLGELVVGTLIYGAFALQLFIRTGSVILPFILMMILGATVLGQMLGVIGAFAGIVILVVPPLIATAMVYLMDSRT